MYLRNRNWKWSCHLICTLSHEKCTREIFQHKNTNLLLTEREGHTGEYWSEVVTVRTERSEVRTKTTEGQYSPVRPEQARLVSSLLYGTLFLIVKCTSGGLHLKNVRLLHPSLKFRKKFNLFSFCPLVVKNDNFHPFFFTVLVANVEFDGSAPKQKYGLDRFHGNGPYCKILTEKEPMRAQGLGLPYNKSPY